MLDRDYTDSFPIPGIILDKVIQFLPSLYEDIENESYNIYEYIWQTLGNEYYDYVENCDNLFVPEEKLFEMELKIIPISRLSSRKMDEVVKNYNYPYLPLMLKKISRFEKGDFFIFENEVLKVFKMSSLIEYLTKQSNLQCGYTKKIDDKGKEYYVFMISISFYDLVRMLSTGKSRKKVNDNK